jgi:hypothetical protein
MRAFDPVRGDKARVFIPFLAPNAFSLKHVSTDLHRMAGKLGFRFANAALNWIEPVVEQREVRGDSRRPCVSSNS